MDGAGRVSWDPYGCPPPLRERDPRPFPPFTVPVFRTCPSRPPRRSRPGLGEEARTYVRFQRPSAKGFQRPSARGTRTIVVLHRMAEALAGPGMPLGGYSQNCSLALAAIVGAIPARKLARGELLLHSRSPASGPCRALAKLTGTNVARFTESPAVVRLYATGVKLALGHVRRREGISRAIDKIDEQMVLVQLCEWVKYGGKETLSLRGHRTPATKPDRYLPDGCALGDRVRRQRACEVAKACVREARGLKRRARTAALEE